MILVTLVYFLQVTDKAAVTNSLMLVIAENYKALARKTEKCFKYGFGV